MKYPYVTPEAEIILFRALEKLANTDATDPDINLDDNPISDPQGGVDWEW